MKGMATISSWWCTFCLQWQMRSKIDLRVGRYVTAAIVDFTLIDVPAALVSTARITSRAAWARERSIQVLAFNQVLHREIIFIEHMTSTRELEASSKARMHALSERFIGFERHEYTNRCTQLFWEGRYKATWKSGIQTPVAQGRFTTIISMIQWTRTSRLSIKISLSARLPQGKS